MTERRLGSCRHSCVYTRLIEVHGVFPVSLSFYVDTIRGGGFPSPTVATLNLSAFRDLDENNGVTTMPEGTFSGLSELTSL